MPKLENELNPERFVIGTGLYTNQRFAAPVDGLDEFRIDPAPMPIWAMLFHNMLFVAFFFGVYVLCVKYGDPTNPMIPIATLGIGTMTCLAYTGLTYYLAHDAITKGPWLVYDKSARTLHLPRQQVILKAENIIHIQYITTGRMNSKGRSDGDRVSELNVVANVDGERRRFPLLRSLFTDGAFEYITVPMVESTDLVVKRVREEWLSSKTTESKLERGSDS